MNKAALKWVRFAWKLDGRAFHCTLPEGKYAVRQAERAERTKVEQVVKSSFDMDSAWARFGKHINDTLQHSIEESFTPRHPECLVLVHGTRVIGTSVLNPTPDHPGNLTSGPCVLIEYRSRGMGTILLAKSLEYLAGRGLSVAHAMTPAGSIAARYVYPKFDGVQEPCKFPGGEAAG